MSSNVSIGLSIPKLRHLPPTKLVPKARNMRPAVLTVARNFILTSYEKEQLSIKLS